MSYVTGQRTRDDVIDAAAVIQTKIIEITNGVSADLARRLAENPRLDLTAGQLDEVVATVRAQLGEQQESLIGYLNWAFNGITETIITRFSTSVGRANDLILDAHATGLVHGALVAALTMMAAGAATYGGYKLFKRLQAAFAEAGPADESEPESAAEPAAEPEPESDEE
jgi:hypothetical protein